MTEAELAELCVYRPAEVARMLNTPITRLERWAREDRVLHLRAGARGVEFTAEDVRRISRGLPELMRRHGGRRTATPDGQPAAGAQASPEPSAETIAGWAQLITPHRSPRRSTR